MINFEKLTTRFKRKTSGVDYRTIWQILHLDLLLSLGILILLTFGFIILYSAVSGHIKTITQELVHVGMAFLIMFIVAQISPNVFYRWAPILYIFFILILFAVLISGHIGKGAQRWLNLGIINLQPSEMMKIIIPMILARYFAEKTLPPNIKDIIKVAILILIPTALVLKQPDLGTAIILILSGLGVLILAGMRWKIILLVMVVIILFSPVLWHFLHGYQQKRILIFLNPELDPLGAGYHIIQSKIAIGSGGIFGKGWLSGTQSHLHFLPEHATDFIFAVCGEEFGFFGCVILLLIYTFIIIRMIYISLKAQDTFTRLFAGGISITFFLSYFINIGMVTGLLPVVGIPLPLISYGGSSMITMILSFGILMSIHGHRKLIDS